MWYLSERNSQVVTVSELKSGDTITFDENFGDGVKVERVQGSVVPGRKEVKTDCMTWAVPGSHRVRRLTW